jgi:hypothetical protein
MPAPKPRRQSLLCAQLDVNIILEHITCSAVWSVRRLCSFGHWSLGHRQLNSLCAVLCLLPRPFISVPAGPTVNGQSLGRRALQQSTGAWGGASRPEWFNNNRVQSGTNNWAPAGNTNWGTMGSRPQWPSQGSSQAIGQATSSTQVRPQLPNPRNRKGDLSALSTLTAPTQGLRGMPRQTIAPPTTGPASTLYQGLRKGGNARANAQSLAETFRSNSDAAATAVASAATDGGASFAVAEAVAQTTVNHPSVAPGGELALGL